MSGEARKYVGGRLGNMKLGGVFYHVNKFTEKK